ncbi:MAG TPA: hypothetical protein VGY13_10860 [Solirubrobacteraceae bacterium]|nr:hypothetical protein [Solirubrobacteraceae bacterium]
MRSLGPNAPLVEVERGCDRIAERLRLNVQEHAYLLSEQPLRALW